MGEHERALAGGLVYAIKHQAMQVDVKLAAEPKRWMRVMAPVLACLRLTCACLMRNVGMTRWMICNTGASSSELVFDKLWQARATVCAVYFGGERLVVLSHQPVKRSLIGAAAFVTRRLCGCSALARVVHRGNRAAIIAEA